MAVTNLLGDLPRVGSTNVITVEDRFYSRKKRFYNPDGTVKYLCVHTLESVLETTTSWEIAKFTYANGLVGEWQGWLQGAVNSESVINALSWNI